jgi:hypothetical protein
MDMVEEPPFTVLRTEPIDQSGLHGVMQRLLSLGLDLLEVRIEAWGTDTEPSAGSPP